MSQFFINRPVFAWVIAILIMLAGALSLARLPVSQYPPIAPPAISIETDFPGASAQTLEDTVTQIIEQKMTGLDHLLYMSSASDATGHVEIILTFAPGADPDTAQVQVQNKLALAEPLLPAEVQRQGISVTKSAAVFLKIYAFHSPDGSKGAYDLADFVAANIQDQVGRMPGVGQTILFGGQYAMRIWMDPRQLRAYNLMPSDLMAAIADQNAQISAGQLGGAPSPKGQKINVSIAVQERLKTAAEFGAIILRTLPDGSLLRVRDVARVELGAENYATTGNFVGAPSAGIAVKLATGTNALDTVEAVDAFMDSVRPYFPAGIAFDAAYDSTPFVRLSIRQVFHTLFEAILLVTAVMFLFLQSWRATLIPLIAVPVVLLGTFGALSAFGYSITTLTMFGLVLAIGLLVDDAIVVVENVERVMHDEKLPPREATRKSMREITGALAGIAAVLAAVFVPMAFMDGSVGIIYRQFSVTMVTAMTLSVVVAVVLTPALCATMLKAGRVPAQHGFFGWFNRAFSAAQTRYRNGVACLLHRLGRALLVYALIGGGVCLLFRALPSGFLPDEDQGNMFISMQLPPTATMEATAALQKDIEAWLDTEKETVRCYQSVIGFSFSGRGQNNGIIFVTLKDWSERTKPEHSLPALARRAQARFAGISKARVFAFQPPAIMELGNASGFDLMLQDRAGLGHAALLAARNQLLGMAAQDPALRLVRPNGMEDQMQMRVHVDREKAGALGLRLGDINQALAAVWGSIYADDFLDQGRVKKVYVQGDAPFRMLPEDMERWHFRNAQGDMVPFSAFAECRWEFAPTRLERYNGLPAMEILGQSAPNVSTGEAMRAMETLLERLPQGIGHSWTGLSFQERQAGSQTAGLFALSVLVVFLCLAALYESWSIPFAVVLTVPLGVFGALAGSLVCGFANDVYFRVGLLATIGLSAKNAILIVEFARELMARGQSLSRATVQAARMRLRPILMTSFAFLLGIVPLMLASGAGAGGQNSLGTGVFAGVLTAIGLGLFFIPVFFVLVTRLFIWRRQDWRLPVPCGRGHTTRAADTVSAGAGTAAPRAGLERGNL